MNSYLTKEEQLLLAVREEVSKYNKCVIRNFLHDAILVFILEKKYCLKSKSKYDTISNRCGIQNMVRQHIICSTCQLISTTF